MDAIAVTRARRRGARAAVPGVGPLPTLPSPTLPLLVLMLMLLPLLLLAATPSAVSAAVLGDYTSGSAPSSPTTTTTTQVDAATLVQCQTATEQAERSATFAGEMTMIPGAVRMAMRIELLERSPGETGYHPVLAPGVGVWRTADPGVKAYKHLEQVTNLAAPAHYRALITFRWLGSHGRLLRREERRSASCVQPAPVTGTGSAGATPTGSSAPLE